MQAYSLREKLADMIDLFVPAYPGSRAEAGVLADRILAIPEIAEALRGGSELSHSQAVAMNKKFPPPSDTLR